MPTRSASSVRPNTAPSPTASAIWLARGLRRICQIRPNFGANPCHDISRQSYFVKHLNELLARQSFEISLKGGNADSPQINCCGAEQDPRVAFQEIKRRPVPGARKDDDSPLSGIERGVDVHHRLVATRGQTLKRAIHALECANDSSLI